MGRYEVVKIANSPLPLRLDRWTGDAMVLEVATSEAVRMGAFEPRWFFWSNVGQSNETFVERAERVLNPQKD